MTQAVLVGNNLALLIAADLLARAGRDVILITDNKRLGGHFYGFSAGETHFDIGVVFLEWLETDGKKPPLKDYNPALRYDWTRYATAASEWVQDQSACVPIAPMETIVEGKSFPDYIFTNHLDMLASMPVFPPSLLNDPEKHPRHKLVPGAYDTLEYDEAAKLNHGAAFHTRFINGFIDKLLAGTTGRFLARYHRNIWAPLFYPETLAAAIKGEPHNLRAQHMWTTTNGFVGKIIRGMIARLEQAPHVKIMTSPIQSMGFEKNKWSITLQDNTNVTTDRVALGLANDRANTLLGTAAAPPAQALSISVLLAQVKREAIGIKRGCLTIADPVYKAYRLSDQDVSAGQDPDIHRISIEANASLLNPDTAAETLRREIKDLMDIKSIDDIVPVKHLVAKDVLPLAEKDYVSGMHDFATTLAAAAPNAKLSGANLGYGVATLNDQIVQGLMIGEWLER